MKRKNELEGKERRNDVYSQRPKKEEREAGFVIRIKTWLAHYSINNLRGVDISRKVSD